MSFIKEKYLWLALRLSMAWIFLWPFFDKVFGLGFATESGKAWIDGVSPTYGFLTHATQGPFAGIFQAMAGNVIVDWLFMLGLLGIGLALLINKKVRFAGYMGALLMLLMWLAVMPPEHNPFLDDHIVYGLLLLLLGSQEKK